MSVSNKNFMIMSQYCVLCTSLGLNLRPTDLFEDKNILTLDITLSSGPISYRLFSTLTF